MKSEISVLIIDDEAPARALISVYLQHHANIKIMGEASNGFEAAKMIRELAPQLIFLDIQMPKINGFEMLELIENPPLVVFTTAYDQYAIKAFELQALAYLLKPFSQQRFDEALFKALRQLALGSTGPKLSELKLSDTHPKEYLVRIAVKDRQQIHVIAVGHLLYIEADGDYVKLHAHEGVFLKEKTMKYFEENLIPQQFVRIHRSCIVNIDEVSKIELYEKEHYRVALKNGQILKASQAGYQLLKQRMG